MGSRLYVALIHYPVIDKNGQIIASAVTNLDLHDIARACRTYGVAGYYIVTPLEDQIRLVKRILDHWTTGAGARYNPKRHQALELIRVERRLRRPPTISPTSTAGAPRSWPPPPAAITAAWHTDGCGPCWPNPHR
nr:RNA methyltransferase [Desulfosarcina cetonica]